MRWEFTEYCKEACGNLKPSQRQCHGHSCHLKKFMERTLPKIPKETMSIIANSMKATRLKEDLKSLKSGAALIDVNVTGKGVEIAYEPDNLGMPEGIAIILAIYRSMCALPLVEKIEVYVMSHHGSVEQRVVAQGARATALVGQEGMSRIRQQWMDIWDYFRPAADDPKVAAEVLDYLSGADIEVRLPKPNANVMGA